MKKGDLIRSKIGYLYLVLSDPKNLRINVYNIFGKYFLKDFFIDESWSELRKHFEVLS